jgi:hypothetical protein
VAAALAFLVEPLVARSLLPTYGGTSAVWTTALVFFQATLLCGYAWTHVTLTRLGLRRHALLQVGLVAVALATLMAAPLAVPSFVQPPSTAPTALWLVLVLTAMVGLPFLALSSASPTTQRWFAALPGGVQPYRLFAASNAGSLIGLVAYPTLGGGPGSGGSWSRPRLRRASPAGRGWTSWRPRGPPLPSRRPPAASDGSLSRPSRPPS